MDNLHTKLEYDSGFVYDLILCTPRWKYLTFMYVTIFYFPVFKTVRSLDLLDDIELLFDCHVLL